MSAVDDLILVKQRDSKATDYDEVGIMIRVSWAMLLAGLLISCSASNSKSEPRDGDADLFASEVQPVIRSRCAFIGCHGREAMPFTLYALDYLRLRDPEGVVDPTRPPLDERALTPAELAHNRHAIAGRIGVDDPAGDRERFLRRLIPLASGGIAHSNVEVFATTDDPDLDAIRRFLETVK